MKEHFSLDQIAKIYDVAKRAETVDVPVEFPDLRHFHRSYKKLRSLTQSDLDDELWSQVQRVLSRYLYGLLLCPLPLNTASLLDRSTILGIRDRSHVYRASNPAAAEALQTCVDLAVSFMDRSDNPMFLAMRQTFPRGVGRALMLVRDARVIPLIEPLLRKSALTSGIRVVTANQLKGLRAEERLIVVGPLSWHPAHVNRAKKAVQNIVLRYSWLSNPVSDSPVLIDGWHGKSAEHYDEQPRIQAMEEDEIDALPEEFFTPVDWARIHKEGISRTESVQDLDRVSAKTFLLEGEVGVFLEDDPTTTGLVIDLDAEDPQQRVIRVPIKKLEPGQFVILKKSGEGDFTVAFANQLMGDHAASLRELQADWKIRLREMVEGSTLLGISIMLLDLGSTRAMEANLRNWISPRNIRTHDQADFRAILRLTGLENRFDEYWDAMDTIARFHQRAGQQIRRQLLRKLRTADLASLERLGRLDITLADATGAGTLTAFRILGIDEKSRFVHVNQLNRPFAVGGIHG